MDAKGITNGRRMALDKQIECWASRDSLEQRTQGRRIAVFLLLSRSKSTSAWLMGASSRTVRLPSRRAAEGVGDLRALWDEPRNI